jgi:ubiquinol-cytochrome c reductase cytochrome b subunit
MLAFASLHTWLVLKLGINEWPMPGRIVKRDTYIQEYNELSHTDGIPFVPGAVWKDAMFAAGVVAAVAVCALFFGPIGPGGVPDPTIIQTAPKPDYFFLWIYTALAFLPPSIETPLMFLAPAIAVLVMLALPFYAGVGEKSWHRRPVAVILVVVLAVTFATLTHLGTYVPWSPQMDGWSADPVPVHFVEGTTPLERQGAIVFQEKQCRNCHQIGGAGGRRGPALDEVATRLTDDQLVRQVVQGGGNMPAYGKTLSPAQVTALVAFLETLHPAHQQPAIDVSRHLAETDNPAPKEPVEAIRP